MRRTNELAKTLGIEFIIAELKYDQDEVINKLKTALGKKTQEINKAIDKVQGVIRKLEEGARRHTDLLDRRKGIDTRISSINTKLLGIKKARDQLTSLGVEREQKFLNLLSAIKKQRDAYNEVISAFSAEKADVLGDLTFMAVVGVEMHRLLEFTREILDQRRISIPDEYSEGPLAELCTAYFAFINDEENAEQNLLRETKDAYTDLLGKLKPSEAITSKSLADGLWKDYLFINPQVKYKGLAIDKLSLGQKATVLIKIYLAHGLQPIVIDSHDDHLDNEFIMDELVRALRQAKQFRQIILVSNNGNVVVNSDAEQVVVAHRRGTQLSYKSGSLEDPVIRELALKVLEGGKKAFRSRQYKYRLNQRI